MRIAIFDSWGQKFTRPVAEHWRSLGHEVHTGMHWSAEIVESVDVAYFYPVDNNLIQASKKQGKPPNVRIIAEAVDIDIYAGHPGAVQWEYVDALIFMAHHTKELSDHKFNIPRDLPQYIVPGGIDTDRWTLRKNTSKGYNVAFIGRFWIAKNMFGALQIFNQLIKTDPGNPWKLYLRGENYDPLWWQRHVEAYIEASPGLKERIEFVPWVEDLNEWLEDKSYLIQSSFKESFAYVVGECASKGLKPIIQMTTGVLSIWPSSWVFQTHDEAVQMFLNGYDPETYRAYVADRYPLSRRLEMLDEICGIERGDRGQERLLVQRLRALGYVESDKV